MPVGRGSQIHCHSVHFYQASTRPRLACQDLSTQVNSMVNMAGIRYVNCLMSTRMKLTSRLYSRCYGTILKPFEDVAYGTLVS